MSISKINISNTEHQVVGSPRYAICDTAAGTVAKVAALGDNSSTFTLESGARICVKFINANSAASPTLNVASTGAKAIYWHGAAITSSQYWQAGAVLDFVYNDTQWDLVGVAKDNNTTYSNATTSAAGLMSKDDKSKLDNLGTLVGSTSVSTQISNYAAPKSHTHNYYVKGTQTATTNAFTGVLNEVSDLYEGLTINYWLPYAGNNSAATLNLTLADGSTTGALPVYYSGLNRFTTHVGVNNVMTLIYQTVTISGKSYPGWWLTKTYDSNTISQLRYDNTKVIAGTNGIYGLSLIALDSNNQWQGFVKSRSTGTTKTINTEAKFRLPINILYYGTGNDATSGKAVSNTYALYTAYPSIDLRYSHNYTTTFTVNTPVYLEGTIDSNGYFSVTSTCITQTLTTGKYYIFLGTSGSSTAYQLALHTDHPIYYYDGTNLVDYTRKLYGNTLSVSGKTVALKNGLGETLSSITTQDTTYSAATIGAAGLMSAADKTKLDGIATGANKITVDSALSTSSTNPVQNKLVTTELDSLKSLVADMVAITNAQIDAICGASILNASEVQV